MQNPGSCLHPASLLVGSQGSKPERLATGYLPDTKKSGHNKSWVKKTKLKRSGHSQYTPGHK